MKVFQSSEKIGQLNLSKEVITHASLFSGIGGAELAAQMMGWKNVFHCEINKFGNRILSYWFPESKGYEDITKTDFRGWRGKVAVLTAGFPCQPFSLAGRRKGADDDRYLWPQTIRVIEEVRPPYFVGENVAGILSMVQPDSEPAVEGGENEGGANHGEGNLRRFTIEQICRDLEGAGYAVRTFVIPACAIGAPHRRDRVWIVAKLVEDPIGDGRERKPCESKAESRLGEFRQSVSGDGRRIRIRESEPSSDPDSDGFHRGDGKDEVIADERRVDALDDACEGGPHSSSDPDVHGRFPQGEGRGPEEEWRRDVPQQGERGEKAERADGLSVFQSSPNAHGYGLSPAGAEQQPARAVGVGAEASSHSGGLRRPSVEDGHENPGEIKGEQQFKFPDSPQDWWRDFPSQPPVCGRDDGLPFDVDDLTIPYRKWREESLKAFGNAWVPQVAHEIFLAIEKDIMEDKK